jgi:peptide/nickel transport system permease protein
VSTVARGTVDVRPEPGAPAAQQVPGAPLGGLRTTLRRNPRLLIGGSLVLLLLLMALLAPALAPYDPIAADIGQGLQPPSPAHWLGTDDQGRDVLSRVMWGARISLSVALISVGIGLGLGTSLGLVAGYLGGGTDLVGMRLVDALLAFPALLLAIAITAALGPQIQNAMIAIGIVAIPAYARLTRGQVLSIREQEFVRAALASGAAAPRIMIRHIMPNVANPLIVQATFTAAVAILLEAVLSFLGLGAQPPNPSWGSDINYSQRYLINLMWWMSLGPGLAIFVSVLAFNILGDGLRDWLDPALRRRG